MPNGASPTDTFLECLGIAGVGHFARATDRYFQRIGNRNLGLGGAGRGNLGGFGLKSARG